MSTQTISDPTGINDTKDTLGKLDQIREKNKCIRVQFLDWLSDKVKHYGDTWSAKLKEVSDRIDAPCVIKIDKKPDEVPFNQAKYFYDAYSRAYVNIAELKAGKSQEEYTYYLVDNQLMTTKQQLDRYNKVKVI